jgi:hypothetical protein
VPSTPSRAVLDAPVSGKFCRVVKRFHRMNPRLNSARRPFDLQAIFMTASSESLPPHMCGEA